MPLSRRAFVETLGLGGAALIAPDVVADRGREGRLRVRTPVPSAGPIRLNSNENPLGPFPVSLQAMQDGFQVASRYPRQEESALRNGLADLHGAREDQVIVGCGSTEILTTAVAGHTSPTRHLVTASPTFETAADTAMKLGHAVESVPVTDSLHLDLEGMLARARGAGLVFLCNPNNPTGTVHGGAAIEEFIDTFHAQSPETVILVDEAYHDYVTDPAYHSVIPLALSRPNVIVSRTFSKAYGMAGMRVGYALGAPETLAPLREKRLPLSVNVLALLGARAVLGKASLLQEERERNRTAREYTRRSLANLGFASAESNTNFIMVKTGLEAEAFQTACRRRDVWVGRPFPPLTSHARISIGTMEEMRRALPVFEEVLSSGR